MTIYYDLSGDHLELVFNFPINKVKILHQKAIPTGSDSHLLSMNLWAAAKKKKNSVSVAMPLAPAPGS